MATDLGPDEGINRLKHPDCRACAEHERLCTGLRIENAQLKKKLNEGGGDADAPEPVRTTAEERQLVARAGLGDESGPAYRQALEWIAAHYGPAKAAGEMARAALQGRELPFVSTQPVPETARCNGTGFLHEWETGTEIVREGRCPGCINCARAALADFDDHGDYEAPVAVLRKLVDQLADCKDHSGKGEG